MLVKQKSIKCENLLIISKGLKTLNDINLRKVYKDVYISKYISIY